MSTEISYNDCLNKMFGLRRFGIKLGLCTITNILNNLENPHRSFKSIHIAGTNGKGSIASALAAILRCSGYTVGLYTSPHLVRFNERIRINNSQIADKDVVLAYNAVKNANYGKREPTFFEFATAMAFYEFGLKKVDWAVIETGMGGRLDATNIIQPEISVITNISIEHQAYLGDTISQITREKGGIIKEYSPVITGVQQKQSIAVLEEIAQKKQAPFYRLGDKFNVIKNQNGTFTYYGIENIWPDMRTGLLGNHQVDNAALVLATCEMLFKNNVKLTIENIKKGLLENVWPGRLEVISSSPHILLDGAHNLVASQNLAEFIYQNFDDKKVTLVLGILDDKPYSAMLENLLPICSKVILTRPIIERAISPEKIYPCAKAIISDVKIISNVTEAFRYAVETALPDEVICVAGSLYVVGEVKEYVEKNPLN